MTAGKRRYITSWILFVSILLVTLVYRELSDNRTMLALSMYKITETIIYTGLAACWGVSVRRRIVQPQIRRLLECVSLLILFWLLTRSIKYHVLPFFADTENMRRYLWYLYYIPMIFLPTVMLMTAFCLRKPENYRLPKKAVIAVLSVSAALFLLVFTNDLHQLVFCFPPDATFFTDSEYDYGFLYYLCLGWNIGCLFVAFFVTIKKCRLPHRKKTMWVPLIPAALWGVYGIMYIIGNVSSFFDITFVDCFLLISTLELSISIGLIPSNMHYEELFRASDISAIITDEAFQPIFTSGTVAIPDKALLKEAAENSSVTKNGMRVSAHPVSGGYIFWQDDMTELSRLIGELEDLHIDLEDQQLVLRERLDTQRKNQRLIEKNHLYNMMQTQTQDKVARLYALAQELGIQTDEAEIGRLISEIAVISVYLKRRNNLIFIAEESDTLSAAELEFCLKESISNLSLCGATCDLCFKLSGSLAFEYTTKLYDAFETAVETVLPALSALFVVLCEEEDKLKLTINAVTDADAAVLADCGFAAERDEDGEWTLTYTVVKGGEHA